MRGAALKIGQFMKIQDSSMLSSELEDVFPCVQNSANCIPEWQSESCRPDQYSHLLLNDGAPSGSRAGSAVAPSPRYPSTFEKSQGRLHQPTLDGPSPSRVPNGNDHADPTSKADTSATAAALDTSTPSQPAWTSWTVGSAPATRNRASSSSSRSPRFDGFFPFNSPTNAAAESESAMDLKRISPPCACQRRGLALAAYPFTSRSIKGSLISLLLVASKQQNGAKIRRKVICDR
ncbi:hypothetical protein CF326_g8250 [Tilletia indica]|nr:hypothetical protein CF326_g8250 [Tilletia indica]